MIGALDTGTLVGDPVERQAHEGQAFVTTRLRVLADRCCVRFAQREVPAACLTRLRKGSAASAAGILEVNVWAGKDGSERIGWRLIVNEIMRAYGAAKRRREAADGDGQA